MIGIAAYGVAKAEEESSKSPPVEEPNESHYVRVIQYTIVIIIIIIIDGIHKSSIAHKNKHKSKRNIQNINMIIRN